MVRSALLAALLAACATPSTPASPKVVRATFEQRLVPDDPEDRRTFRQRYVIDSASARGPDAPVIYFLGNEANLDLLIGTAGYVGVLKRELGAHFVALEHRYYGESIPVKTLTAETMQPLTVNNALSDFARFEEH